MGLCIFSSLCLSTYRHKSDAINILVYNFVKIYMYFSLLCVWDLLGYRICMEKEMATQSSTFAWRILWTEEPGGLLSMGSQRVGHDWGDLACMHACVREGNGNPLQYSCLENPRDKGAWQAAIYGVAQSWTWLKRLSSSRVCICSALITVTRTLFQSII